MTTTPAMPELPEPVANVSVSNPVSGIGFAKPDKPYYSADQMRAYALATLQAQPVAVSDADLYGTLQATIVSRYVVEKRVGGGFWGYCVKAGNGEKEIFVGHKNACEHVRQALQTACLDGAYMAHEEARAILALRPQAVPMTEAWLDDAMRLADAYADASFDQGLNQLIEDPNPEANREKLAEHLRGITAQAKEGGA